MKHEIVEMPAQGGEAVVNPAGLVRLPTSAYYIVAKHGVVAPTKNRGDLVGDGLRCVVGPVEDRGGRAFPPGHPGSDTPNTRSAPGDDDLASRQLRECETIGVRYLPSRRAVRPACSLVAASHNGFQRVGAADDPFNRAEIPGGDNRAPPRNLCASRQVTSLSNAKDLGGYVG